MARWPSDVAMQRARTEVRKRLSRQRLRRAVDEVIQEVNRFLRGWCQYFRRGNSTQHLARIDWYVRGRVMRFISKQHRRRGMGFGLQVLSASGNNMGLYRMVGTVGSGYVQTSR
jgi:hypothetical protein